METPPPISPPSLPRTAGLATASLVLGILSVTCLSILTGIPALIMGIVALTRIGKSAGMLRGQGLAIAGLVMGAVSFALLPFMAGLLLPAVVAARAKAMEAECMNNVRTVTLACIAYADEHTTTLPNTWGDMKNFRVGDTSSSRILICPELRDSGQSSYEIVNPGKRLTELGPPERTIIVREINASHRGKRVVGFADGHVEMRAGK